MQDEETSFPNQPKVYSNLNTSEGNTQADQLLQPTDDECPFATPVVRGSTSAQTVLSRSGD